MQITGYGYRHKHGHSAKKTQDKRQKGSFRPLRRKSNSPFQELKSDAQTKTRMLHGILVFYVTTANFTSPKSKFKTSCAQTVPKFLFFTEKCAQKRLRGNLHEALFFNGREGGIRTHGGSSPHLISSLLFCILECRRYAELLVYKGNSFFVWLDTASSNHHI